MSFAVGLSVCLEFTYSGSVMELTSKMGSFITWNAESSQVMVKEQEPIVDLAVIKANP